MELKLPIKNHYMREYLEIEQVALKRFGIKINAVATRNYLYIKTDMDNAVRKWGTLEFFMEDVLTFHKYRL